MTPDVFWELVKQFGLPLAMAILAVFALWKRWFVTKGELDDKQLELDKMTAQYERERVDRIAAQDAVGKFAPANAEVAQAVADLSETVIRHLPDLYDERLKGTTRRGR